MSLRLLPLCFLLACAAEPGLEPLNFADGCQPMFAGDECFLPYPSDFYLVDDPSRPSGHRVDIRGAAKILDDMGMDTDSGTWRPQDGFSRNPTIIFSLQQAIDEGPLLRLDDDYGLSRDGSRSPTLLIEADSGRAIAHFVDIDPIPEAAEDRAIMIRPMEALSPQQRYIVAVSGLTGPAGEALTVPEGFRRLRDGQSSQDPALAALQPHFDSEIFAPIAAAGKARETLQLAWDFTTASDESITADMFRVRQLTMDWLRDHQPVVVVDEVRDFRAGTGEVMARVYGHVIGPSFLESEAYGALLHKPDGQVEQNGDFRFEFVAILPQTLRENLEPARLLGYGHGFFGSYREAEGGAVSAIANTLHAVVVGIPWAGMSQSDAAMMIRDMDNHPAKMIRFGERVHQAMANWIVISHALKEQMHQLPAFRRADGSAAYYDPSWMGYLGISQGHILGGTQAALNPYWTRIALNVGGCAFTHMMSRSANFSTYLTLLESLTIADPVKRQKMIAAFQPIFDRFDPATYAPYVLKNKLPGSPEDRRILMQTGYADAQVPDFTAQLHARLLGVPILQPQAMESWGLETVDSPAPGSAYATYRFDVNDAFRQTARPTEDGNRVHEGIRRLDAAKAQLEAFLKPGGEVRHFCDGPCDPE